MLFSLSMLGILELVSVGLVFLQSEMDRVNAGGETAGDLESIERSLMAARRNGDSRRD